MRKRRVWKWLVPVAALLAFLLYFVLGAWLPNLTHRQVDAAYAASAQTAVYTSDEAGCEEVYYISDNTQAMEIRLAMIESAQEEIILSTFDFDADAAGQELLAALLHAADRGVEIRLIVDGLSGWQDLTASGWFQALANSPQAEIKIYNPLNPLLPWQTMYRLHDKYLIVDEEMYLLGGRNSTDLFLGDYSAHENLDSEVFVRSTGRREGDSLEQLLDYFQQVWALPESVDYLGADAARGERRAEELAAVYGRLPETYPAAFEADYLDSLPTVSANKITLLSNPIEAENMAPELWTSLVALMSSAEDVFAVTPYVILSDEMESDLAAVCSQTSSFTLMLNDVTSGANPWGCVDYLNEKDEILATGVTVAEYLGEHSLHTKNILLDDRLSVVGSFNFDMRSAYLDTELMLVIDSTALNAQLREKAASDLEYCRVVTLEGETLGSQYEARTLEGTKEQVYTLLRTLIRPFRCLL